MRMHRPLNHEVDQLRSVESGTVSAQDLDFNAHMNVNVYFRVLTTTTIHGMSEAGLGYDYPATYGCGLFSVDHHVRYLSELRLGDEYSTHVRLLSATDKGVHVMAYLRDVTHHRIAATLEGLLLNVDHTSRRVSSIAEPVLAGMRTMLALHTRLECLPYTCGRMQLPGRAILSKRDLG